VKKLRYPPYLPHLDYCLARSGCRRVMKNVARKSQEEDLSVSSHASSVTRATRFSLRRESFSLWLHAFSRLWFFAATPSSSTLNPEMALPHLGRATGLPGATTDETSLRGRNRLRRIYITLAGSPTITKVWF